MAAFFNILAKHHIQLLLLNHENAEQVLNSWMMTHPPLTEVGPPAATAADKT